MLVLPRGIEKFGSRASNIQYDSDTPSILLASPMAQFFQFESDFVDALRCIPMQVRFKLDTCGVKLKLAHWNQFSLADRQLLVEQGCTSATEIAAYRQMLQDLVVRYSGSPASALPVEPTPPWEDSTVIPETVQAKAMEVGQPLTPEQWAQLQPLQRFALIKLSRSSHENANFLPALKEFHLVG